MNNTDNKLQEGTNQNEPIKHHFIPQFIIRNFCFKDEQVYYWNKNTAIIETRNTKSVFMEKNLYRDDNNHPTDPAIIEKKFSKLESEIAVLFQEKILDKDSIKLTRAENEKLRKFLYLLSFRSSTRKQQYIDANFDEMTKKHLSEYVTNNDYVDLWLREIEMILDTENYNDLQNNTDVSWTIRTDFWMHLSGYYMTFVTPRGQDFIIGDIYPTAEIFPINAMGTNLYPHYIFPITPNLLLLLNHVGFREESKKGLPVLDAMVNLSIIKGNAIKVPLVQYKTPGLFLKNDTYTYIVHKIYVDDVVYLNNLMLNEVRRGFGFSNQERVLKSIQIYQSNYYGNNFRKNDFSILLDKIAIRENE